MLAPRPPPDGSEIKSAHLFRTVCSYLPCVCCTQRVKFWAVCGHIWLWRTNTHTQTESNRVINWEEAFADEKAALSYSSRSICIARWHHRSLALASSCTRLEFQKSSRGRLNSICDLFELCCPERAREREMKLQKKTSRSQHVYLFVWCERAVRLAALAHRCMRRQCAEILPRSQELDLQLHQQGQSWTLTLFSVPIIAFRIERDAAFCFFARRRSFHTQHTSKRQMLKVNLNFSLLPVSLECDK